MTKRTKITFTTIRNPRNGDPRWVDVIRDGHFCGCFTEQEVDGTWVSGSGIAEQFEVYIVANTLNEAKRQLRQKTQNFDALENIKARGFSPEHTERLLALAEYFENEVVFISDEEVDNILSPFANIFNMAHYAIPVMKGCVAPNCVAGYACIMAWSRGDISEDPKKWTTDNRLWYSHARDWLGLSDEQAFELFVPGALSEKEVSQLYPFEVAKVIRNLVDTDNVDWSEFYSNIWEKH